MKKQNLVGMKFGKLTVDEMLYNYQGKNVTKCSCTCDCGKANIIRGAYELKKAQYSSCGCDKKNYIIKSCGKNINGKRFGRLTVIDTYWDEKPSKVKCICDCGNIVILDKKSVQNNHTKSCGCLSSETTSKLNQVNHTGKISDYGVKIIRPAEINEKRQWLWYCQCGFCGREFKEIPARVLGNHVKSCGCLKKSSREVYIEKILNDLAIDYKTQYTFNDCRSDNGHTLRFDFAIMKGDRIFCLIEYDGQQHYMPISIWGGEESYEQNIIRDSIKNVYCAEHNLKLLRLPYYLTEQEIKQKIINTIYP